MNLVLFIGDDCPSCHRVEEAFRKRYKEELDSGEADIVNLDQEEDAQQFWMENNLPLAPTLIVVSDKRKLITILDADELLTEASPAAAAADKQA